MRASARALVFSAGACLALAAAAAAPRPAAEKRAPGHDASGPSASAFVRADVDDVCLSREAGGEAHVVFLRPREDARLVPIWIGPSEALAITLRLARRHPPRPLTHDLLEEIVRRLGARIDKVYVEALKAGVFVGRVFVRSGKSVFDVDARASDSIALAVGASAPLLLARAVIEEAGVPAATKRVLCGGEPPGSGAGRPDRRLGAGRSPRQRRR